MKYEVVKWSRGSANTIWSGDNRDEAILQASFAFAKEVIRIKCLAEGSIDPWNTELDVSTYGDKVEHRFIAQEKIDFKREAEGEKGKIFADLGDKTIERFSRARFS